MPVTRRTLLTRAAIVAGLGGLAATGLSGCGIAGVEGLPDPLRAALQRESDLLTLLTATGSAHPSLTATLAPLLEDHRAHRDEIRHLGGLGPHPTETPEATDPATGSSTPGSPAESLVALARAESQAAERARQACVDSAGVLAGTFASIGGCEASHAFLLAATRPAEEPAA